MGKVKEIVRTANVAWSPRALQSIYLIGGTVAQQLDATFSTSANLELFSLDLASSELAMPLVGRVESPQRFHKLIWSHYGVDTTSEQYPMGVVIGGSDNGGISLWNVARVAESDSDGALITQLQQHVGPVRALDINPFQPNLLASGASESEIYIWDLSNPGNPMSPGNKLHPLEDISCVAWNRQVQHILASTSPSGRSVVWDLRKNEPIIQVSDSSSRIRCKAIAWHPDVATQMVTASEDDRSPVIQLWDLRYATAPVRTLERHKKGILSLAWCPQDPDLLLSSAKDNTVFCWNPNRDTQGGEVVYELPATSQWIFECLWCPRNPAVISTASFDGHVTLYSLLGGGGRADVEETTPTAAPSDDPFAGIAASSKRAQAAVDHAPLKSPPKWFKRPCGANFGFGGKLVSFSNTPGDSARRVVISQVTTEPELLQRSKEFESVVEQQRCAELCSRKVEESHTEQDRNIWSFLKATFEPNSRRQYLNLLGYNRDQLDQQFAKWESPAKPTDAGLDVGDLQQKLATLPITQDGDDEEEEEEEEEDTGASGGGTGGLFGSTTEGSSAFDGLQSVPAKAPPTIQPRVLSIPTGEDMEGMLAKALLVGNLEAAVKICIQAGNMAEALILSVAGGQELLQSTQKLYFEQNQNKVTKLISLVANRSWSDIARYTALENWREVLAAMLTYAAPEDLSSLCDILGERLEAEGDDNAALCYICSGNIEKFVECWNRVTERDEGQVNSPLLLQDLVEKLVVLRKAVEEGGKRVQPLSHPLIAEKLSAYAHLLASQGSLTSALGYIKQTKGEVRDTALHHRILHSGSVSLTSAEQSLFPFERINVLPSQAPASLTTSAAITTTAATTGQPSVTPSHPHSMVDSNPAGAQPRGARARYVVSDSITQPLKGQGGYHQPQPHMHGVYGHHQPAAMDAYQPTLPMMHPTPSSQPPLVPPIGSTYNQPPSNINIMYPTAPSSQAPPMAPPTEPALPSPGHVPPPGTDNVMAWNDPPMLKTKKATPTHTYKGQAPITAPITAPVQPMSGGYTQPIPPTSMGHHAHTRSTPPPQPQHENVHAPSQVTAPPPQPVEKPPIPAEHQVLVSSFNGLLTHCRARANNAVTRRKVEDISNKLEVLYDLLREASLSHEILQGLHFIAQDTQSMNYQGALARLNHMVATSNLTEISAFVPGIKTLLQLRNQLR